MGAARVLKYKTYNVDRQDGETARLRILKGPDTGVVHILRSNVVNIGRAEDVDVMISDLKTSRKHARLELTAEGWVLSDLSNSNGIIFEGQVTKKCLLRDFSTFMIGETVIEFIPAEVPDSALKSPMRSGAEIISLEAELIKQKNRLRNIGQGIKIQKRTADPGAVKKRLMMYGIALAIGAYAMQDEIISFFYPKKPSVQKKSEEKTENSELSGASSGFEAPAAVAKTSEQYFREGFREYREGNLQRAKNQFELCLEVNPAHGKAKEYLRLVEAEIQNRAKEYISRAQQAKAIGRISEAKSYYEDTLRLLYFDQEHPNYLEASKALEEIKKIQSEGMMP